MGWVFFPPAGSEPSLGLHRAPAQELKKEAPKQRRSRKAPSKESQGSAKKESEGFARKEESQGSIKGVGRLQKQRRRKESSRLQ